MRIVGCGLVAVAALLGLAPTAMAGEPADVPPGTTAEALPSAGSDARAAARDQTEPQAEVSMLAVSLTAGAAVAAAGSGVAHAVSRRRAVSRAPGQATGNTVRL